MEYTINHFYDTYSEMFYFTSDLDKALIARKMEIIDNVIPASNSSIAKSLFVLGKYFDNNKYHRMAEQMLHHVMQEIPAYGSGYSNWAMLLINMLSSFYEIAIVGKNVDEKRKEFNNYYFPNKIFVGSNTEKSLIPLLENKFTEGKTMIYVCENKTCKLPVTKAEEVMKQISE